MRAEPGLRRVALVRDRIGQLAAEIEVGRQLMIHCAKLAQSGTTPPEMGAISKAPSKAKPPWSPAPDAASARSSRTNCSPVARGWRSATPMPKAPKPWREASTSAARGRRVSVSTCAARRHSRLRATASPAFWGWVDIVVNNAGHAKRTPTEDITPEEFDEIVAINMRSVFFSCQVFGEHMRRNGHGRIVNITSLAGQNGGTVASPHYAAAKAGALMLTKYFAQLLADTGVTVNAIAPGPIATANWRLSAEQIAMIEQRVPIRRFGEAAEIAAAVALLASDRGGYFVGTTLDLKGGLLMRWPTGQARTARAGQSEFE